MFLLPPVDGRWVGKVDNPATVFTHDQPVEQMRLTGRI
jgi:hypothetical protein